MSVETSSGGTGSRLARATVIVAGVASIVASLLSLVSIWLQTKNYRKPLLQRYVFRILIMVPIYAVSSWTSIVSLQAASWIAPIRDIYEAFTIYTFFQLLINFLGGERALIVMTHGRPPVQHAWPLHKCLPKVDISDPYTFLTIKRGILQYAWLKPVLALVSIIMKATGTYQEGFLGPTSGYLWTGIIYNLSVTVSLYSLALFWVCMHEDLKPFRPVPKFLCIKLVIFASYWQGFFLSILQWLGALENGIPGYTPDNLAAAIQDSLICFEMPIFAIAHWYAFSWHDYADPSVSSARMPIIYALRDAFGIRDLIEDSKETFRGEQYQYRFFDSGDNVMAHEESNSRLARVMHGMRYERGGKAKYWIPRPGDGVDSRTPLLGSPSSSNRRGSRPGSKRNSSLDVYQSYDDVHDLGLDDEDERLFDNARLLEFGDWNYPVIPASDASPEHRLPPQTASGAPSSPYTDQPIARKARKGKRRSRSRQSPNEPSAGPSTAASATNTSNEQRSSGRLQNDPNLFFDGAPSAGGERDDHFRQEQYRPPQNTQVGMQSTAQTTGGNYSERQQGRHGDPADLQPSSSDVDTSDADEGRHGDSQSSNERLLHDFGAFDEERDAWSGSGVLR